MYTQCPECATVYEVTPDDLAVAGGLVRCGSCQGTFNALRRLREGAPVAVRSGPRGEDPQTALEFDRDDSAGDRPIETTDPDAPRVAAVPAVESSDEFDQETPVSAEVIAEEDPGEALVDEPGGSEARTEEEQPGESLDSLSEAAADEAAATTREESVDDEAGEPRSADTDESEERAEDTDSDEAADVEAGEPRSADADESEERAVDTDSDESADEEDDIDDVEDEDFSEEDELDEAAEKGLAGIADDESVDAVDTAPDTSDEEDDALAAEEQSSDEAALAGSADDEPDVRHAAETDTERDEDASADDTGGEVVDDRDRDDEYDEEALAELADAGEEEPDEVAAAKDTIEYSNGLFRDVLTERALDPDHYLHSEDVADDATLGEIEQDELQFDDIEDRRDLARYLRPRATAAKIAAYTGMSMMLLLLLAAQAIHHWRRDLAVDERFRSSLVRAYDFLGLTLEPAYRTTDYEVARYTVVPNNDAPPVLMARATVVNRADGPRPYPLIRLTFSDVFGEPVYVGTFEPEDYLLEATPTEGMLAARGRAEVSLDLQDVDTKLGASYVFHVCMPTGGDGVVCDELVNR